MESSSYEWYFRLFGGLEAQSGSLVITRFRTTKTGLLLGYLVAQSPHRFAREQLAELLWHDSEPEQARASLSVSLSALRQALTTPHQQEPLLITDRTSVGLDTRRFVSDIQEFEQAIQVAQFSQDIAQQRQVLIRALDLYQGEFMAGYYADWVSDKSLTLHFQILSVLERLIALDTETPDRLTLWLQRLVELDPFNPQRLEQLVRHYEAQGNHELAYRTCEAWQKRWANEMEGAPPTLVQHLAEQVGRPRGRLRSPTAHRPPPHETRPDKPPTLSTPAPINPAAPASLPRPAHPCFGRSAELQEISELIRRSACVTIIGLGGMGKTRMALEVAHHFQESGEYAPHWVSLLSLSNAEEIPRAIAESLGLPGTYHPMRQLALYCQEHPDTLVVLDNLEHLMPEARSVMAELLEAIPPFRCLVTSRIPLHIAQEQRFTLEPLALGSSHESPALQMFLAYARKVRPDFRLTEQNKEVLCRLCEALEGVPLALELSATRLNVLTPRQMLEQMEHRLSWLRTRHHGVRERHQSLRAVLDTTMTLLSPEAQEGFTRLAVFPCPWTLEQAQQVCFPETSTEVVQEWLEEWIEAGLVRDSHQSEAVFAYMMLEVVREYALGRLDPSAHDLLWRAHRDWVLQTAQACQSEAYHQGIVEWLRYWDTQRLNLWQAIEFSLLSGEPAQVVHLMWATQRYYFLRPYLVRALGWLDQAITAGIDPEERLRAGVLRCHYLFRLERFPETYHEAQTLLTLCTPDHPLYGWVLYWLMHSAYMVRDLAFLESHREEAYALWQATEEPALSLAWNRLFFYLVPCDDTHGWVAQYGQQAQRSGDPLLIRYAIEWQSEHWMIHGDYARVWRLMDTLEQNPLTQDDAFVQSVILITRALCHLHAGRLELAEPLIHKRLQLDSETGTHPEPTLITQLSLLRLLGRYDEALQLADQLLMSPTVQEWFHLKASTLELLARTAMDVGDWRLVEDAIEQAMQARYQEADPYRTHFTAVAHALVKARTQPEESLAELERCLQHWRGVGVRPQQANTLMAMAEVFLYLERLDSAEHAITEACQINQALGRSIGVASCKETLARIRHREGRSLESQQLLQEAESLRNQTGAPRPPAWQL